MFGVVEIGGVALVRVGDHARVVLLAARIDFGCPREVEHRKMRIIELAMHTAEQEENVRFVRR